MTFVQHTTPPAQELARGTTLLLTLAVAAAFAAAFWPVGRTLLQQWMSDDTYSFGILVPFISAYLIWLRRVHLLHLRIEPSLSVGSILALAAAALLTIGRMSVIVDLQEISMVLMMAALVVLLLGWAFLRALAFPLAYLLLMLPIWEIITSRLHYPSQLLSAGIGQFLLSTAGIPVYRDQTLLSLPNITLEVASVCSGINSLIAVVAVAIPHAYLFLSGVLPRLAVVALAMILALLGNGVRIALIGTFSYYGLSVGLHGPGHVFQGLFVSAVGFLVLFAGVAGLAKYFPRAEAQGEHQASTVECRAQSGYRTLLLCGAVYAFILLVATIAFRPHFPTTLLSVEQPAFAPSARHQWTMTASTAPRYLATSGTGTPSSSVYRTPAGQHVEILFANLAYNEPGVGLVYRTVTQALLPNVVGIHGKDGQVVRVNHATLLKSGQETHVVYWYEVDGQVTANLALAKAYTALHLVTGQAPRAKLVMVSSDLPPHSAELMTQLVRDVLSGA